MTFPDVSRSARSIYLGALAMLVAGAAEAPVLTIDGSVSRQMSASDLAALPRATQRLTAHGTAATCTGARLADVLARAGVPAGEAVRGAALTTVIIATAADGYRVAFTLGEIDPLLGDAPVIVADRCDGKPLGAADGPLRLVVATGKRGARSIRQLVRLTVAAAPGG